MPFPSLEDLPDPGTEPRSPELQTDSLLSELQGSPLSLLAAAVAAKSLQSCLTLYDSMDCSPPGSSVHGILQAGILEWSGYSPGNLPNPGTEPRSLALQEDSLLSEPPRSILYPSLRYRSELP